MAAWFAPSSEMVSSRRGRERAMSNNESKPGHKKIERPDVASFHPPLARSLAPSTVRMSIDQVCDLLVKTANLG
jgi:hypothetical protein